jgi:hypothetical protein
MKSSCHILFNHPGTSDSITTPSTTHSSSLLLQFRNSALLYRCSTYTHYRKRMSRDCYSASPLVRWLSLQKTRDMTAKHCWNVPRDSDPRNTALARASSIYKRQTRSLVREGAPQKQDQNCQTIINIWS